jgi:hypothetical protein
MISPSIFLHDAWKKNKKEKHPGWTYMNKGLFQPSDSVLRKSSLLYIFHEASVAPYSFEGNRIIISSMENIEPQLFSGMSCCLILNVTRYLIIHRYQQSWKKPTAARKGKAQRNPRDGHTMDLGMSETHRILRMVIQL